MRFRKPKTSFRSSRRLELLLATLALTAIVACAGTMTIPGPRLEIPGIIDIGFDELTITFRLLTNEKYYVTFKKDGEPIAEDCIEGGEGTIANPNGGDWDQFDYTTTKPTPKADAEPVERLAGLDVHHGDGLIASPVPISLKKEFLVGCFQGRFDTTQINTNYTLTVSAGNRTQASGLGSTFGQNGPGAPVSSAIHVDSYLRWTVIGSDLWIGSSKVGADFVNYQLTVNGSVVADLGTQTNIFPLDEANGWRTLWSAVPASDLNLGTNSVDIVQRAVGESQSTPIHVEFDL